MAQRYLHFSAFLPLFFLWREKISCFFLLLLSFKTNLEAYPLLLSCLLDVHLLLFSLQPPIIFSHTRFTRFSNLQKKKEQAENSLFCHCFRSVTLTTLSDTSSFLSLTPKNHFLLAML